MKTKPLKMRTLFILLFFVFTGFSNIFAQSQTQTTYEKMVLEIKVKYLSILYYGYEKELTFPEKHYIESLIKDKSEEQEATVLANSVMNYAMTHSEAEIDSLLKRFQNEMKNAEKLKPNVDLKREKEKKEDFSDGIDDLILALEKENTIYDSNNIEVQPNYPGGETEFRKFIAKNYRLNADRDLKGQVLVQFVVEKDGSLSDIKVLRDLGHGTGAETIRVLKRSQKWNPGTKNGKPVPVKYTLPIQINISSR